MGVAEKIGASLIPPGMGQNLRWRLTVSGSIAAIGLWIFWSMGLFAFAGFSSGLARADETKKLGDRLEAIERNQDITTKLALAGEVCRIYYLRMTATGPLLVQLSNSFEEKQQQYSVIAGSRYNVAECTPPG